MFSRNAGCARGPAQQPPKAWADCSPHLNIPHDCYAPKCSASINYAWNYVAMAYCLWWRDRNLCYKFLNILGAQLFNPCQYCLLLDHLCLTLRGCMHSSGFGIDDTKGRYTRNCSWKLNDRPAPSRKITTNSSDAVLAQIQTNIDKETDHNGNGPVYGITEITIVYKPLVYPYIANSAPTYY